MGIWMKLSDSFSLSLLDKDTRQTRVEKDKRQTRVEEDKRQTTSN